MENSIGRLNGSIFYVQKGSYGFTSDKDSTISLKQSVFIDNRETDSTDLQRLFLTKDYPDFFDNKEFGQYLINEEYIIFWNDK